MSNEFLNGTMHGWAPSPLLQRTIDRSAFFFQPGCTCCGCRCHLYATHRRWNLSIEKQWDRNIDRTTNNGEGGWPFGQVNAVGMDDLGFVYVTGKSVNGTSGRGPTTLAKFDPDGRCVREVPIYGSTAFSKEGLSLHIRPDVFAPTGRLVTVSTRESSVDVAPRTDLHVYDLALDHVWSLEIDSASAKPARAACMDASGNVYVARSNAAASGAKIEAYDSAGSPLWTYGGGEVEYFSIVTDDTLIYAGSGGAGVQVLDLSGVAVDFAGTISTKIVALAVRGGVLVTGAEDGGGTCDIEAWDTTDFSAPLWSRSRGAKVRSVAIGADGTVYTVGDHPAVVIFDSSGSVQSCHQHGDSVLELNRWAAGVAVSDVALVTGGNAFTCNEGEAVTCADASCAGG